MGLHNCKLGYVSEVSQLLASWVGVLEASWIICLWPGPGYYLLLSSGTCLPQYKCLGLSLGSVIWLGFARTSLQIIPCFVCLLQKLWVNQVWAIGTQLPFLCHGVVSCFSISLHFLSSVSTFLCTLRKGLRTWTWQRTDTNIRICVTVVIIGLRT